MNPPADLALDRPPFALLPALTAEEVARTIEACFHLVFSWPDRVTRTFVLLADQLPLAEDSPLRRAGIQIAQGMDAGIGADDRVPYHNRQHFCEVMLAAHYIGLLAALDVPERAELLFAALVHDYGHDGGRNGDVPFRLERESLRAIQSTLDHFNVDAEIRARLAAMVLATEVSVGLPAARAWLDHYQHVSPPPETPESAPELFAFATDAHLPTMAIALAEADALGSAGLGRAYADLQQDRLAREWGYPLSHADKVHYLDHVFGGFVIARRFNPNFEALRAELGQEGGKGSARGK